MKFSLSPKAIITIIYLVGIIGICSPWQYYFLLLTPVNLLITFGFVLKSFSGFNKSFAISILILVIATWLIEVIGVQTGLVFGHYTYGKILGPKIFDTPPIIGINWAILLLSIGIWLKSFNIKNNLLFSLLGAITMTLLDLIIEPIAILLGFWNWQTKTPPLQNYVAWFIISFIIFFLFPKKYFNQKDNIAIWCLGLQFIFFALLNITFYFFDIQP